MPETEIDEIDELEEADDAADEQEDEDDYDEAEEADEQDGDEDGNEDYTDEEDDNEDSDEVEVEVETRVTEVRQANYAAKAQGAAIPKPKDKKKPQRDATSAQVPRNTVKPGRPVKEVSDDDMPSVVSQMKFFTDMSFGAYRQPEGDLTMVRNPGANSTRLNSWPPQIRFGNAVLGLIEVRQNPGTDRKGIWEWQVAEYRIVTKKPGT